MAPNQLALLRIFVSPYTAETPDPKPQGVSSASLRLVVVEAQQKFVAGIYELLLHKTTKKLPEQHCPVIDTSTYVRGEENLHGWRPRGESLILDNQELRNKLNLIEETERARHLLQVWEKVRERERILQGHSQQELTLSDETKEELAKKCVNLLTRKKSTSRKEKRRKHY